LAFLGGFSAATSMVIVSAIALSTMMSNHIIMPVWIWLNTHQPKASGDVRGALLISRRVSIGVILGLGYIYYRLTSGSEALASIGLISFLGAAQLLPSLVAGLYWHGATRTGAICAVIAGFVTWAYTLFLPSFGGDFILSARTLVEGPFGIGLLKPQDLFGAGIADPLVHALVWSMIFNVGTLITGSLMSRQTRLEPLQAEAFIDVFETRGDGDAMRFTRTANAEDLFELAQRILGRETAHRIFSEIARSQGKLYGLPDPGPDLTARLERELAGAIGAASAHAMVSQIGGQGSVSVGELIRMADETAQIVNYAQELEAKSQELEETAAQLRRANAQLTRIGEQKDAFLSQVSHELRTPMTSIRSFAEILRSTDTLEAEQTARFTGIIHEESMRLTRLLDEILDVSVLESGRVALRRDRLELADVLNQAIASTEALTEKHGIRIVRALTPGLMVEADVDRLAQVMINVISNAVKYGRGDPPEIHISSHTADTSVLLDFSDNGPGIPKADQGRVFEKFARLGESTLAGSAGLGLPISREIMKNLGGDLELLAEGPGATFRLRLPNPDARRTAAE
ncbi:MAG: ATP-binding protein, partial [Pseudomonadota bacterium]